MASGNTERLEAGRSRFGGLWQGETKPIRNHLAGSADDDDRGLNRVVDKLKPHVPCKDSSLAHPREGATANRR